MILDTSAVVAIVFQEPDHAEILGKLLAAPEVAIGAPSLCEAGIVVSARLGSDARPLLSRFLLEGGIETIPFGEAHFGVAVGAWLRYGRGREFLPEARSAFLDSVVVGVEVLCQRVTVVCPIRSTGLVVVV